VFETRAGWVGRSSMLYVDYVPTIHTVVRFGMRIPSHGIVEFLVGLSYDYYSLLVSWLLMFADVPHFLTFSLVPFFRAFLRGWEASGLGFWLSRLNWIWAGSGSGNGYSRTPWL
jgi:hypothetical protein